VSPTPGRMSTQVLSTLFEVGTLVGETDGQLMERFAARRDEGGDRAFAALVERHGPMVLRTCRGILRDDHEAMDAFQATFLVLARGGRTPWVRDSLGPWLHRVACRAAGKLRAREGRGRALMLRAARPVEAAGDGQRDERAAILHEELDRLPERYRVPIVLCDLEGRTCEEVAHHLGRSVRTVKNWRARGRERLKGRLTRRGLTGLAPVLFADLTPSFFMLPGSTVDVVARIATAGGLAGLVPAGVLSLTEGVLRSMLITKLKIFAAVILAAGFVSGSAVVLAYQAPAPEAPRSAPRDAGTMSTTIAVRSYYVGDLIEWIRRGPSMETMDGRPAPPRPRYLSPIMELITSSVAPGSWQILDENGQALQPGDVGKTKVGTMTPFFLTLSLNVRHTTEVHAQVEERLRQLRRFLAPPAEDEGILGSEEVEETLGIDKNGVLHTDVNPVKADVKAVAEPDRSFEHQAEHVRQLMRQLDREIEALTRAKLTAGHSIPAQEGRVVPPVP
jgi:RNA polymerase sigma factor (sigma-70 family)